MAVLSGCAGTRTVIQSGNARLLPNTVSESGGFIYGLIEANDRRHQVSIFTSDCERGTGTLFLDDSTGPINNVLRAGNKPEDDLFRQLCAAAGKAGERPR